MKRKILSVVLALVMVLSMTAVSFADTANTEKVSLTVTSGDTIIEAVAYDDYTVVAGIGGEKVNQNLVTATLTMTNVAGLGVDGTRTATYTLDTGLGNVERNWEEYFGRVAELEELTINAKVNEKAFTYDVQQVENADYDYYWEAKTDEAAARAAWQELTAHIATTEGGAEDGKIVIKAGTTVQVGTEVLTFGADGEDFIVDNLNSKNDDMTGQVLDAVTMTEADNSALEVYLPEGSALYVGGSSAILSVGTTITLTDYVLPEGFTFEQVQEAANAGDAQGIVTNTIALVNGAIGALVDDANKTVGVEITTDCYKNDAVECPCDTDCCTGCDPVEEQPTTPPTEGGETDPTVPPTTDGDTGTPQTSDDTPVGMFGAIALAAVVAMAGVVLTRKRATER